MDIALEEIIKNVVDACLQLFWEKGFKFSIEHPGSF